MKVPADDVAYVFFARMATEKASLEAQLRGFAEGGAVVLAERLRVAEAEAARQEALLEDACMAADIAHEQSVEASANHSAMTTLLSSEREALLEEIERLRVRCEQLEARGEYLDTRLHESDMRQAQGKDEKQQLQGELLDRKGERAILAAENESVERVGSEQQLRAQALESHVARLSAALEEEDADFARKSRTLQSDEARLGTQYEDGLQSRAMLERAIPRQLEQERAEVLRCAEVASSVQRDVTALRERRLRLHNLRERAGRETERLRNEFWRAEGVRDAARAARRGFEGGLADVEAECVRLESLIERIEEQNVQLARSQLPLQKHCSALVSKGLRQAIRDFAETRAHPDS